MKKIDLGQATAVLANLGVIGGIVFLAIETRQNNQLLEMESNLARTEAYVARTGAAVEMMQQLALSPALADLLTRVDTEGVTSLSESERLRVWGWELSRMYGVSAEYYRYQQGLLSEDAIDNVIRYAAPNLPLWRELGIEVDNQSLKDALQKFEAEGSR